MMHSMRFTRTTTELIEWENEMKEKERESEKKVNTKKVLIECAHTNTKPKYKYPAQKSEDI